ncbi:hypothetical protein WNY37_00610 [Henriciella sp. AS95]|uniref:hypothetical protein n=1 Tax=Henriciella sp. AS95 TaxID=3135782 RepID=UPI00316CD8BA
MIMSALMAASCVQLASFDVPPQAQASLDDDGVLSLQDGLVWTDLPAFENGTLEADILLEPGRAFTGILFRAGDSGNGEMIYLRHHQSGLPDAWQYHPRYHGHQAYQIYQGEGFAGETDIPLGRWARLRLVVNGDRASLSIDGEEVAFMHDLQRKEGPGRFGFWALLGERSIRNVCFSPVETELPEPRPFGTDQPVAGLVPAWRVSSPFDWEDRHQLVQTFSPGEGEIVRATHRGIADLNRVAPLEPGADTVLASLTLESDAARTVMFDFGFSDDVAIYLNGTLLYEGSDRFRSRDYRFLGTVGLYDSLPLRLEAGNNTLVLAIGETEGGWAVSGRLADAEGVSLRP